MSYQPTLDSVRSHEVPEWYCDAKLGIMVTWGLYSVPAYAPTGRGDMNQLLIREGLASFYRNQPYAEWYVNSLRLPGSPVHRYHLQKYGSDFAYESFAPLFLEACARWDPGSWANLFARAGARYVVFVTKHMDGFLHWPSATPHPFLAGYQSARDQVGELARAVRECGMRYGLYYSSALDLSFGKKAIRDFVAQYTEGGPIDRRYIEYMEAHWRELIDRYRPSVLWGDIAYPPGSNPYALFAYYYNRVPEGAVNDRWLQFPAWFQRLLRTPLVRLIANRIAEREVRKGNTSTPKPPHYDFLTPEYEIFQDIRQEKWETVRGIGYSFSYNRNETESDHLTESQLIHLLADVVSKNGNLHLDVGPMADGAIPDIQRDRLIALGRWLEVNGEAIYGTRPWLRAEGSTAEGLPVRFTSRGDALYAIVLGTPGGPGLTLHDVRLDEAARVRLLGRDGEVAWQQRDRDLLLDLGRPPAGSPACAFQLRPVRSQRPPG